MENLNFKISEAVNEPIKDYLDGSSEKESLLNKLEEMKSYQYEIPIIINGQEVKTTN